MEISDHHFDGETKSSLCGFAVYILDKLDFFFFSLFLYRTVKLSILGHFTEPVGASQCFIVCAALKDVS